MDLLPTSNQLEIVSLAADFFDNELPMTNIRERRDEPAVVDDAVWASSAELGLFGLGLPEELGGAGFGLAEETLLFREMGRRVAPGPYLSTVLGARVAALTGQTKITESILAGEAAVGLAQRRGSEGEAALGHGPIDGRFDLFDAGGAPYVLVVEPAGAALLRTADLTDVTSVPCIDPGVRLASAVAEKVTPLAWLPAETTAETTAEVTTETTAATGSAQPRESIHLRGLVLAAAILVGIAEATRDMSAGYAKVRVQFGRPIGVNQAIKHVCADMATRADAAYSQLLFGAVSVESGRADAEFQALSAKVVAGSAAVANVRANIQVHGGMGYTFEHDSHLFMKRAHVLEHWLGEPARHLHRLLDLPAPQ